MPSTKGAFSIFALTITKGLPKRLSYSLFNLTKKDVNSIFALTLTKGQPQKSKKGAKIRNRYNQAPDLTQDTNGKVKTPQLDITNEGQEVVFLYFALTLAKGQPQRVLFSIFAQTLTKGQPLSVFFSIYSLILTKGLP